MTVKHCGDPLTLGLGVLAIGAVLLGTALKLSGVALQEVSWWFVTSPLWFGLAAVAVVLVTFGVVALFAGSLALVECAIHCAQKACDSRLIRRSLR